MSSALPKPIDAYLASENAHDVEALAACFAIDAIVRDEGRTIEGLAAIKAWKAATTKKYQHSIVPIDAIETEGRTIVTAEVSGNFPGSPIHLQFIFGLTGDKIASLEIR